MQSLVRACSLERTLLPEQTVVKVPCSFRVVALSNWTFCGTAELLLLLLSAAHFQAQYLLPCLTGKRTSRQELLSNEGRYLLPWYFHA